MSEDTYVTEKHGAPYPERNKARMASMLGAVVGKNVSESTAAKAAKPISTCILPG